MCRLSARSCGATTSTSMARAHGLCAHYTGHTHLIGEQPLDRRLKRRNQLILRRDQLLHLPPGRCRVVPCSTPGPCNGNRATQTVQHPMRHDATYRATCSTTRRKRATHDVQSATAGTAKALLYSRSLLTVTIPWPLRRACASRSASAARVPLRRCAPAVQTRALVPQRADGVGPQR